MLPARWHRNEPTVSSERVDARNRKRLRIGATNFSGSVNRCGVSTGNIIAAGGAASERLFGCGVACGLPGIVNAKHVHVDGGRTGRGRDDSDAVNNPALLGSGALKEEENNKYAHH